MFIIFNIVLQAKVLTKSPHPSSPYFESLVLVLTGLILEGKLLQDSLEQHSLPTWLQWDMTATLTSVSGSRGTAGRRDDLQRLGREAGQGGLQGSENRCHSSPSAWGLGRPWSQACWLAAINTQSTPKIQGLVFESNVTWLSNTRVHFPKHSVISGSTSSIAPLKRAGMF